MKASIGFADFVAAAAMAGLVTGCSDHRRAARRASWSLAPSVESAARIVRGTRRVKIATREPWCKIRPLQRLIGSHPPRPFPGAASGLFAAAFLKQKLE